MIRLYTVAEPFHAKSADGESREFILGEVLRCDLQQSGETFQFASGSGVRWFVDRQTFEECCIRMRAN
jgi:hypothetical protein